LFDGTKIQRDASRGIRRYLEKVRDELRAGYDSVHENYNKYKRTDELYNSFHIAIDANGQGGWLTNDATDKNGKLYAVYVIGPKGGGRGPGERQSQLQRQRGWPSITDVARRNKPFYRDVMNRAIAPSRGDIQRFG
jgi:hypothetical protein